MAVGGRSISTECALVVSSPHRASLIAVGAGAGMVGKTSLWMFRVNAR